MNGFNVEIQYLENKKGATLEVWPGNLVKVIAPLGVSESDVKGLVSKRTKWIIEKQRLIKDIPAWRKREFVSGESFPILGREYRLKVIEGYGEATIKDNLIIVPVVKDDEDREELVRLSLIKLYKTIAKEKVLPKVLQYSDHLGEEAKSVSFKDYEGRWGSCTPQRELIFNWQIVALPRELFEFVIAHEVCHLKEMNHSKNFKLVLSKMINNHSELSVNLTYYRNIFSLAKL